MKKKTDPSRATTLRKRQQKIHDAIPVVPESSKEAADRRERVKRADEKLRQQASRRNIPL